MDIETRTGLGGHFVVADNADSGEPLMEILDIGFHCPELRRGARVLGRFTVPGATAGIDDMSAYGVVAFGAVGDFPWEALLW